MLSRQINPNAKVNSLKALDEDCPPEHCGKQRHSGFLLINHLVFITVIARASSGVFSAKGLNTHPLTCVVLASGTMVCYHKAPLCLL